MRAACMAKCTPFHEPGLKFWSTTGPSGPDITIFFRKTIEEVEDQSIITVEIEHLHVWPPSARPLAEDTAAEFLVMTTVQAIGESDGLIFYVGCGLPPDQPQGRLLWSKLDAQLREAVIAQSCSAYHISELPAYVQEWREEIASVRAKP